MSNFSKYSIIGVYLLIITDKLKTLPSLPIVDPTQKMFIYRCPHVHMALVWIVSGAVARWPGGQGGQLPPQRALKRGRQNDYRGGQPPSESRLLLEDCTDVMRIVCCLHVVT